jgi:putative hydrolases of HD superfamily
MSSMMEFFHAAERLKIELRRARKSNGLTETVAEHSWRLCLMTLVLSENIVDLDRDKCLKMALIHDLPEALVGDAYRLDPEAQVGRHEIERNALAGLVILLPGSSADEIIALWLEFEKRQTREAKFVWLLDRLEVLIQHNESDVGYWSDLEKQIQYGLAEKHAERYGLLREFALEIDEETRKKLVVAGYQPRKLDQATYEKYYGN